MAIEQTYVWTRAEAFNADEFLRKAGEITKAYGVSLQVGGNEGTFARTSIPAVHGRFTLEGEPTSMRLNLTVEVTWLLRGKVRAGIKEKVEATGFRLDVDD
ncbi:MAG: hypothetical protein IPP14_01365 [Planctomycetes bacterium]|nr:hypothetical protein [Planctomycetota bacterium]